ncbi:MAG: membrane protein insertion efficiency factor YidD [Deltaproteobacteria bacterium]|nr:membrane protein insertion efficiency factor YidD [Deltaproteobacteria bacterium]
MQRRTVAFVVAFVCLCPWIRADAGEEAGKSGWVASVTLIPVVHFYRDALSPFMIHKCPMCPSCSSYAMEAMRRHGAVLGWFMAIDRLIHEAGEMDQGIPISRNGQVQCIYDPVRYNDFWWNEREDRITPAEAESIAEALLP